MLRTDGKESGERHIGRQIVDGRESRIRGCRFEVGGVCRPSYSRGDPTGISKATKMNEFILGLWTGAAAVIIGLAIRRHFKAPELIMRRRIVPTPAPGEGFNFGKTLVDADFARRMVLDSPGTCRIVGRVAMIERRKPA